MCGLIRVAFQRLFCHIFSVKRSFREAMIAGVHVLMGGCVFLLVAILVTGGFSFLGQSFHHVKNTGCVLLGLGITLTFLEAPRLILFLRSYVRENPRLVLAVLFLMAVAGLPRFYNLAGHSLNVDEPLWMERGTHLVEFFKAREFVEATRTLTHPGIVPAALIGLSYNSLGRGVTDRSLNAMDRVAAARLPIAVLGTLTCLLLFLVGRKIWSSSVAFVAALFLALDPLHIALSRVAHLDVVLTLFCMLTLCTWFLAERDLSWRWTLVSGLLWGCALLTKAPAWILPGILIVMKGISCARERRWLFGRRDVVWCLTSVWLYLLVYSRMWLPPNQTQWWMSGDSVFLPYRILEVLAEFLQRVPLAEGCIILGLGGLVLHWRVRHRGTDVSTYLRSLHPLWSFVGLLMLGLFLFRLFPYPFENMPFMLRKLFGLGTQGPHVEVVAHHHAIDVGRWFYPFALAIRLPPILLFFAILGCGYCVWQGGVLARRRALFPLLVVVLFVAGMSSGAKVGIRYILPVFPFICILGAMSLTELIQVVVRWRKAGLETLPLPVLSMAAGALFAGYIPLLVFYAPNYFLYHNALIGGPLGAAQTMSVGWGEGQKEAVGIIKQEAMGREVNISVEGDPAILKYYWRYGDPPVKTRAHIDSRPFEEADFLVVTLNRLRRLRDWRASHFIKEYEPDYTIQLQGVDAAWVYRHKRDPVDAPLRVEAEHKFMHHATGSRERDPAASGHLVFAAHSERDRQGWLVRGLNRTFRPGAYALNIRMKGKAQEADASLVEVDIFMGESKTNICHAAVKAQQFKGYNTFQEFSFPFELKDQSEVECGVFFCGSGDVAVDSFQVSFR